MDTDNLEEILHKINLVLDVAFSQVGEPPPRVRFAIDHLGVSPHMFFDAIIYANGNMVARADTRRTWQSASSACKSCFVQLRAQLKALTIDVRVGIDA